MKETKTLSKIKLKIKNFHNHSFSSFLYAFLVLLALTLVLFLNVVFLPGDLTLVEKVLQNWDTTDPNLLAVKKGIWQIFATAIAGVGLTIAAIASQSLTKNPLAEGSTLGLVQSSIFGIIFILSFGFVGYLMKYIFATIFSIIAALLIVLVIITTKAKSNNKLILSGLAIGIIFKTLSFIFKVDDKSLESISFTYVLGGAEKISQNSMAVPENSLFSTFALSSILIAIALFLIIINIKSMNLLEIGDQKAKNLGVKVRLSKTISVLAIILSIPASVILVGNIAFLGLFSVHISRWLVKSRNYSKVLPMSIIVSILIASFGFQLTQHINKVNSGLWMTFIGAPYLIFIGMRGLK